MRKLFFMVAWILFSLILVMISLCVGAKFYSPYHIIKEIFLAMQHKDYDHTMLNIVFYLRFPRVIGAMVIGATLSILGIVSQTLFQNPLASPDVLGVTSGAGLGALSAVLIGLPSIFVFFLSFFSSFLVIAFIYILLWNKYLIKSQYLVLSGLALAGVLHSITSLLLFLAKPYQMNFYLFWSMGSLESLVWTKVLMGLPVIIFVIAHFFMMSKKLDIMLFGEVFAYSHGIDLKFFYKKALVLLALGLSVTVSLCGPIGFISLMIPHIVRRFFAMQHHQFFIVASWLGAMFLLFCDLIGRVFIKAFEIKAGLIASLLGGTYFFIILVFSRAKNGVFHS